MLLQQGLVLVRGTRYANLFKAIFAASSFARSFWTEVAEAIISPSTNTFAMLSVSFLTCLISTCFPLFWHISNNAVTGWGCCSKSSGVTIGSKIPLKFCQNQNQRNQFFNIFNFTKHLKN